MSLNFISLSVTCTIVCHVPIFQLEMSANYSIIALVAAAIAMWHRCCSCVYLLFKHKTERKKSVKNQS